MGDTGVCLGMLIDDSVNNSSCGDVGNELKIFVEDVNKEGNEVLNEDVNSEVSDPMLSPKGNGISVCSCQDISSVSHTSLGCADVVSSTCSSPIETLSEERCGGEGIGGEPCSGNSNCTPVNDVSLQDDVYTSRVQLEIPENVSSSGIRKITFKFSKPKEDYVRPTGSSVIQPASRCHWSGSVRQRYQIVGNSQLMLLKKDLRENLPTNVKKLLATRILDGAHVKYISPTPRRELDGIVVVGGYLCGCSSCNFCKVLNAYEFEQHAGATTKHPNNHIYLENGKPIYFIIQELKTAPFSRIDKVIRDIAGSSINEKFFHIWIAGFIQNNGIVCLNENPYGEQSHAHNVVVSRPNQVLKENIYPISSMASNSARHLTFVENLGNKKRGSKRPNPYSCGSFVKQKKKTQGGSKKRDNDLHRLLFMPNGLPEKTALTYIIHGEELLKGYKLGNGILCFCCTKEVSPSQFEAHAGMAGRRQPYRHIYTSNGLCLHDIALSLANGQSLAASASDDMCTKCGDGADLIFCESCPRAYHPACLDLQSIPEGPWHCPNCNSFQGVNSSGPIIIRLSRVVKSPEYIGGCIVCRQHDFSTGVFDDRTVIICDQCEKEFHVGCLREHGICDLKELPPDNWFCCDECNWIYMSLQNSVSQGLQTIPASQVGIINRKYAEKGICMNGNPGDVQWRILMGRSHDLEHLALLSGASAIFRECFNPIVAQNGRDLIPILVHGKNIMGQEFGGMYCVLLIERGIVVSAGLLRVFGKQLAELPLVATSKSHQGKGYFQALFSCIERLLCDLNVANLVLPAAVEAESIWTRRFGFRKMAPAQLSQYTKEFQLTIFRGTSMLEKAVPQMTQVASDEAKSTL